MRKLISAIIYDFKRKILLYFAAGISISILMLLLSAVPLDTWWNGRLDPFSGTLTFILAFVIYIQNTINQWEDDLPKKLTVHFKYNDKYVLTCHEAYLAAEGDIRAWGQQIGQQMTSGTYLNFFPYLDNKKPVPLGNKFMLYEVTFYLRDTKFKREDIDGKYVVWIENDPNSPINKEYCLPEYGEKICSYQEALDNFQYNNNTAVSPHS
jgi:hypothetical protein